MLALQLREMARVYSRKISEISVEEKESLSQAVTTSVPQLYQALSIFRQEDSMQDIRYVCMYVRYGCIRMDG